MKILSLLSTTLLFTLTLLGCASPPASTDRSMTSASTSTSMIISEPAVKPQPMDVLKRMADYLQTLERFTVRVEKTTELILPNEQGLHHDQTVDIAIQRPNRLRADFQNLSGGRQLFYDGQNFSLYTPEANVYATAPAASTIDETLDLLATQYQISLPIADLLAANPDSRLVQNLSSKAYVGLILIRGIPCYHLAFQTPEVDWEIWIEYGPKPLPRRLALIDKSVEGSPQMIVSLSDWNLTPSFSDDYFDFKPPQNAEKIRFLETASVDQATVKVAQ